jgi:hypothetical protein
MNVELVYTSAAQGLKQGSRGFCTVISTAGLPINLAQRLEALSSYRHVYQPGEPNSENNPVCFSHLKFSVGGRMISVLSRIAAYGVDYSQRTNKIAHHLVVDAPFPSCGPASILNRPGAMRSHWSGVCETIPSGPSVIDTPTEPSSCATWQQLTGDAGWAGVIANVWLQNATKPTWIIFSESQSASMLWLMLEANLLLPVNKRWQATFSTYCTNLAPDIDCRVRCVLSNSEEARMATARGNVVDLTKPMGAAPKNSATEAARAGITIGADKTPANLRSIHAEQLAARKLQKVEDQSHFEEALPEDETVNEFAQDAIPLLPPEIRKVMPIPIASQPKKTLDFPTQSSSKSSSWVVPAVIGLSVCSTALLAMIAFVMLFSPKVAIENPRQNPNPIVPNTTPEDQNTIERPPKEDRVPLDPAMPTAEPTKPQPEPTVTENQKSEADGVKPSESSPSEPKLEPTVPDIEVEFEIVEKENKMINYFASTTLIAKVTNEDKIKLAEFDWHWELSDLMGENWTPVPHGPSPEFFVKTEFLGKKIRVRPILRDVEQSASKQSYKERSLLARSEIVVAIDDLFFAGVSKPKCTAKASKPIIREKNVVFQYGDQSPVDANNDFKIEIHRIISPEAIKELSNHFAAFTPVNNAHHTNRQDLIKQLKQFALKDLSIAKAMLRVIGEEQPAPTIKNQIAFSKQLTVLSSFIKDAKRWSDLTTRDKSNDDKSKLSKEEEEELTKLNNSFLKQTSGYPSAGTSVLKLTEAERRIDLELFIKKYWMPVDGYWNNMVQASKTFDDELERLLQVRCLSDSPEKMKILPNNGETGRKRDPILFYQLLSEIRFDSGAPNQPVTSKTTINQSTLPSVQSKNQAVMKSTSVEAVAPNPEK